MQQMFKDMFQRFAKESAGLMAVVSTIFIITRLLITNKIWWFMYR